MNGGIDEVTIRKTILLDILKENRENHVELHKKAVQGFRREAAKALDKLVEDLTRSDGVINLAIGLIPPSEHSADYDRAIRMLELSVDDEISISEQSFSELIMDDWGWTAAFLASNSAYTQ